MDIRIVEQDNNLFVFIEKEFFGRYKGHNRDLIFEEISEEVDEFHFISFYLPEGSPLFTAKSWGDLEKYFEEEFNCRDVDRPKLNYLLR